MTILKYDNEYISVLIEAGKPGTSASRPILKVNILVVRTYSCEEETKRTATVILVKTITNRIS